MKLDEPKGEGEAERMAQLQVLMDDDLLEMLDEVRHFARLHLIVPIPAFPEKPESESTIDSLKFRQLTTGDIMDVEDKPTTPAALELIHRLTGCSLKQLRHLNPKDFEAASVVAYAPLAGPRFIPSGRTS